MPLFNREKIDESGLTDSANNPSTLSGSTSNPDKSLSASPACNTEVTIGLLFKGCMTVTM